jgi:hypothetical protein
MEVLLKIASRTFQADAARRRAVSAGTEAAMARRGRQSGTLAPLTSLIDEPPR